MRQKTIMLLLALCICLFGEQNLIYAKFTTSFSGGSGTSADPYQISNRQDLECIADMVTNGGTAGVYYELTCDIDLKNVLWMPIARRDLAFQGTFDGAGHTIKGLYVNTGDDYGSGLFGRIRDATIKNLTVYGEIRGGAATAGIVGEIEYHGHIENCANYAKIVSTDTGFNIGGIAGNGWSGEIINCYNMGDVFGGKNTGGIVGSSYGPVDDTYNGLTIKNCYNMGNISGSDFVGGIAGALNFDDNVIANAYNTGTISATANTKRVGAVAGNLPAKTTQLFTNNYYLAGSAAGGANSTEVSGVEVLTAGQMQAASFASALGAAYTQFSSVNGGFPVLASMYTKQTAEIHIHSASLTLAFSRDSYDLGVTVTGDGTPKYTSSKPNVATVDDQGYLTFHSIGNCIIEISMAATDLYYAAESKTIQVYITPGILEPTENELPKAMTIRFGQTLSESKLSKK